MRVSYILERNLIYIKNLVIKNRINNFIYLKYVNANLILHFFLPKNSITFDKYIN